MQNASKRDFTHEFRHSAVMYAARVIHDSINIFGDRLTTAILTIPKWIQAELNTHRLLARNSASSRARPNHVVMTSIMEDPVIPVAFHRNARGMQGGAELVGVDLELAQWAWLNIRDAVLGSEGYRVLTELDVHKQTINRTLEAWLFVDVIVSATDFSGFFAQRVHKDAQPEFQHVARMFKAAFDASTPRKLSPGDWHMPLLREDEADLDSCIARRVSAARCARVSYMTHEGVRSIDADLDLFDRLVARAPDPGHWSPLEHVARCQGERRMSGPFTGWSQLRKFYSDEHPRDRGDLEIAVETNR
jgi:hypothetical protein